jgi:hypothetical protein
MNGRASSVAVPGSNCTELYCDPSSSVLSMCTDAVRSSERKSRASLSVSARFIAGSVSVKATEKVRARSSRSFHMALARK